MYKTLARIITRDSGDEEQSKRDGLLLGAKTIFGKDFFKPGRVYEVVECVVTGTITIRDVGSSWIKPLKTTPCWGNTASHILGYGTIIYLTEEEFEKLKSKESL